MRHVSALILLAMFGCSSGAAPAPAGSGAPSGQVATASAAPSGSADEEEGAGPRKPQPPQVHEAVRIDPTTFTSKSLGRVRFEGDPPYRGEVLEGGDELRALMKEMNELDHVMSAAVLSGPHRIERTSTDFFRIMQHGWLKETRHVELRLPAEAPRPARRFDVWRARDGKTQMLGTVDVDAMDYLAIVSGPEEHRAALGKVVAERNARIGQSVDIPPPSGKRGKWGRLIARGTPAHLGMMRDELVQSGALLTPEGRKVPDAFTLTGPFSRSGTYRWLSVHVPASLTVVTPGAGEHVHLSGPEGAQPTFRALGYTGVKHDDAALRAHAEKLHGASPGFSVGEAGELEVAGRKLRALTFRAGTGADAKAGLLALWPHVRHYHEESETRDEGVALELSLSAGAGAPRIAAFAADATLGPVLDSLYVDFDMLY